MNIGLYANLDLVPIWDISLEQREVIRRKSREYALADGVRKLALPSERWVSRPLLSTDVGLEEWKTPPMVRGERVEWIQLRADDQRWLVIYSIVQLDMRPVISKLTASMGGTDRMVVELDKMYGILPIWASLKTVERVQKISFIFGGIENIKMEGYLLSALVIPGSASLRIQLTAIDDKPEGDRLMLGGYAIEPRGKVVNP